MNNLDYLNSIYPVSRETYRRLEQLVERVIEWQRKTNLIAPSTIDTIWTRHIADSLQCLALMPENLHWLDLGTGGGFPGLVVASVMADVETSSVTLVESNLKKVAFLRQTNRQIGAKAKVLAGRIEETGELDKPVGVVTARALAELPLLLELAEPWLLNGSVGLFHKGKDYREELAKCDGLWRFDLVCHESRVADDSVILEITNFAPIAK